MAWVFNRADVQNLPVHLQVQLAETGDRFERIHLARRQDLCKKAAEILKKDPDINVRLELAAHTNIRGIWRWLMIRDHARHVRHVACRNKNFT